MKPVAVSCLLYAAIGLWASAAPAYEGFTQVGETGEAIVSFVRQEHEASGFSGAVLAGRGGKVIAALGVGTLGDGGGDPIRVDTLFGIASCTKPFTAVAVMKLAEEGRLDLDDPISEHLPGVPSDCRAITVRHLLQHTSGIPRTNSNSRGDDLAEVLPTFLEGGPRTQPGERHEYWNQGYALLSEVIARASGKSYTAYLRGAIFMPCKMKSTRFTGQRPPRGVTVATGVSSRGAHRSALDHPYGEYGFQYRGMGGLVTNLIDLWRWDRSLARGDLLMSGSIAEMTTPGDAGYALGWRIDRAAGSPAPHYHTGSVRGFLSSIRRDPANDGCLFVLANSDESGPFHRVKRGCETILAGGEATVADYKPIGDKVADRLVGTYRDNQGRTLTVTNRKSDPRAEVDWGGVATHGYLLATDTERITFSMRPASVLTPDVSTDIIEVVRDDAGEAAALLYTITANNKRIRFERIAP